MTELHNQESAKEKDLSLPEMLSDLDRSESGDLVRDLMTRAAIPPAEGACDTRPQSPLVSELQNSCQINVPDIYEKVNQSTVKILNKDFEAIGSGFYACLPDATSCGIVTNYHVARLGPSDKTFFIQGTKQVYLGKMLAHSNANDLALIKPLFPAHDLKAVPWGAPPEKNDPVLSVCFPTSRLTIPVVTAGRVLDPSGRVRVNDGSGFYSPPSIITNQEIIGGCSGGPDFDRSGKLIGVTRANGSEGAVVIKAEHIKELLEKYANQSKKN